MSIVAGVDGCKSGWVIVMLNTETREFDIQVVSTFDKVAKLEMEAIGVDMPIGLLDTPQPGGRECDKAARKKIPGRTSSVFSPLSHQELDKYRIMLKKGYKRPKLKFDGFSLQSSALAAKLLEVVKIMKPEFQDRVFEVHPEVSFWAANGESQLPYAKKSASGFLHRVQILRKQFGSDGLKDLWEKSILSMSQIKDTALDDVLDAAIACWTAERKLINKARRLPENGPIFEDRKNGLEMAIWY